MSLPSNVNTQAGAAKEVAIEPLAEGEPEPETKQEPEQEPE